jgi:hypothetical protein
MRSLIAVVLLASSVFPLQKMIDTKWGGEEELVEELMYFPTGNLLKKLVMGYDELAADLVWLRMIQYYGHHRQTDKRFDYLGHILEVLTDLDPRFIHGYTFGALLLTDDAKNPSRGLSVLRKGAVHNPLDWRLPFMSGFINYVFLGDYETAAGYFETASSLPNSPVFAKRFAAFVYERKGDVDVSLELWYNLYETTENEYEKRSALRYIKRIEIQRLSQLVGRFREMSGGYPADLKDLATMGLIDSLPQPPDGSSYFLDHSDSLVKCTE